MELYFYTSRLDVAATSLADLTSLISALADESDPPNAATIDKVVSKIQPLVQSDTGEPLVLRFYDDAETAASWVTNESNALAIGLGYQDANGSYSFSSTTESAVDGTARTATLALNTARLQSELSKWIGMSGSNSRYRPRFYLHMRRTNEDSVSETVALLPVRVLPGVLSNPVVDDQPTQYITNAELTAAIAALGSIYQPLDSDLTAIAALTTQTFGRSLLTQADASATSETLSLSNERLWQIKRWWRALYNGAATMWVWGDSVGGFKPTPHFLRLWLEHGFGGYFGQNYSYTSPEVYTGGASRFSGSIASGDPSFVIWPTGKYYNLPATATISRFNVTIMTGYGWTATRLKVIYHAEVGAGTFKVQVRTTGADWYDAPGASSVDASVGTGNKVLDINLGSAAAWDYRIVHVSGGTVKLPEMGLCNTTGLVIVDAWRGSLPMEYMVNWAAASATTVWADTVLQPDLITIEMKDDPVSSNWATALNSFESLLTAASVATVTDVNIIGTTIDPSPNYSPAQNALSLAYCRANGRAYWDGYNMGESYAILQAQFNTTPGDVHLNAVAQSFFSDQWARDMRLYGNLNNQLSKPLRNENITALRTLNVAGRDVFSGIDSAITAAKAADGEIALTGAANNFLVGSGPTIGTSDFTLAGFAYFPRVGSAGATSNAGFLGLSSSASSTAVANALAIDYNPAGDEMRITLGNATGLRRMRCTTFLALHGGAWRFFAIRRTGGKIYFNIGRGWVGNNLGESSATYSETTLGTTSPPAWGDTITATNVLVGRTQQNGIQRFSELAVYARALTNAEVFAYADTGIAPASPDNFYEFNERAGTVSFDSSGNARHLTHQTTGLWLNANRVRSSSTLRTGTATLVGGTVTIADTATVATTRIIVGLVTPGGTTGALRVSAKTNGTSFVITSTSGTDTSVIYYEAFEP